MRRPQVLIGLAALASLAGVPAAAQSGGTSESDLRCAAWAALSAGSVSQPEAQTAFSITLTWFLGRYEAATGVSFEEALSPAYLKTLDGQFDALQAECLPRMESMGQRLTDFGAALSAPAAE